MEIRTVGVVGLGTMGAGIAQVCVQAGVETVGREVTPELAERGPGDDRALPRARRREGAADAGRDGRRARPAAARDRPRRARRLRPRDRGDRRAGRGEEGAVRRARAHRLARRRSWPRTPRRSPSPRSRRRPSGPSASSACTSSTRRRCMPLVEVVRTRADRPGRPRRGVRVRGADRQGADPLLRHARLRRQPRADPAPERLRARARRGRRDAGGPRQGDAARHALADRALRARST